jgi:hypothetical protein
VGLRCYVASDEAILVAKNSNTPEHLTKMKVSVKWGKEKFDDVELDTSGSVADFKALLLSMTGGNPICAGYART